MHKSYLNIPLWIGCFIHIYYIWICLYNVYDRYYSECDVRRQQTLPSAKHTHCHSISHIWFEVFLMSQPTFVCVWKREYNCYGKRAINQWIYLATRNRPVVVVWHIYYIGARNNHRLYLHIEWFNKCTTIYTKESFVDRKQHRISSVRKSNDDDDDDYNNSKQIEHAQIESKSFDKPTYQLVRSPIDSHVMLVHRQRMPLFAFNRTPFRSINNF